MSPTQTACLIVLAEDSRPYGEMCLHFKPIECVTGLERKVVRRAVRALARAGLAEFHRGLRSYDGEFVGAGYCITPQGLLAAPLTNEKGDHR